MSHESRVPDQLVVQWYGDEGNAMIFQGEDCIAHILSGNRDEVTARIKMLGLRPRRWCGREWGGFESVLEPLK